MPLERVIEAAIAAGALAPADVVRHGVLVEQMGRSHQVVRVSIGGTPKFMVKSFGRQRGATDGMAGRERAVLALADQRASISALIPAGWPWQPDHVASSAWTVIATTWVPGDEAWRLDVGGGGTLSAEEAWGELVSAIAEPLARMHRDTRDLARSPDTAPPALAATVPWALTLMDGDAPPELWETPVTATLLAEAAADVAVVQGLRQARNLWRPMALIHADLKHDNVLLDRRREGTQARVIDWEMARIGDPAWDLAGLLGRILVTRDASPPWGHADQDAASLLVGRYATASGLGPEALAQRVVFYSGAILLMMALQQAAMMNGAAAADVPQWLVARSRATFQQAPKVASLLAARDVV